MAATPSTMTNNPDEIVPELTQQELWDDSTLVEAWEDALNEYKKYHSFATTGQNPETVVTVAEDAQMVEEVSAKTEVPVKVEELLQQVEEMQDAPGPVVPEEPEAVEVKTEDLAVGEAPTEVNAPANPLSPKTAASQPETPAAFPFAQQHPAGLAAGYAIGGNDEAMRNLMMSWYWAGYYTGLQEGQQKPQQPE